MDIGFGFPNLPGIDMGAINQGLARIDAQIKEGLTHAQQGQQQLVNGVFDPNSVVPGIGIASDIPKPPAASTMRELSELQKEHQVERQERLQDIEANVCDKVDLYFADHHMEFDANGNPTLDANGKPAYFDGAETPKQSISRRKWERAEKKKVKEDYKNRLHDIKEAYQKVIDEEGSKPDVFFDPEKKKAYWDKLNVLFAEEQRVAQEETGVLFKTPHSGLPDPENPGSTLGNYVDGQMSAYDQLAANQKTEENNSPAAKEIAAYGEAMRHYLDTQKRLMENYMQEIGADFDPNALRNFARGQGI